MLIRCEGGQLSIEKHTYPDPRNPLLAVPQEMLLSTERVQFRSKGDEMYMEPEKGALTDLQTRTAETVIELYNLTDKIRLNRESCCWLSFRDNIEALDAILESRSPVLREGDFYKFAKGQSTENVSEIECETYIKTRVIGLKNVKGEEPETMHTYIMPIIDFLNHHVNGANYMLSKGEEAPDVEKFMQVRDHRPLLSSNECFAYYNMLDMIDTFITYGFPDIHAPYVRSVPLEVDLGEAGKLIIRSTFGGTIRQRLHKNIAGLRPYIPSTLRNDEEGLELSHMLIPSSHAAPNALRRVLRMLISGRAARILNAQQVWDKVLLVEEQILKANSAYCDDLLKKADAALAKGPDKHWELARFIARAQQTVLSKYIFEASHFEGMAIFDPEHQEDIPHPAEAAE